MLNSPLGRVSTVKIEDGGVCCKFYLIFLEKAEMDYSSANETNCTKYLILSQLLCFVAME